MIIAKCDRFLLKAGYRIGTAQLASKKRTPFSKTKFSNVFISLMSVQNKPLRLKISTFSKIVMRCSSSNKL